MRIECEHAMHVYDSVKSSGEVCKSRLLVMKTSQHWMIVFLAEEVAGQNSCALVVSCR
jgi:hypothetical protein